MRAPGARGECSRDVGGPLCSDGELGTRRGVVDHCTEYVIIGNAASAFVRDIGTKKRYFDGMLVGRTCYILGGSKGVGTICAEERGRVSNWDGGIKGIRRVKDEGGNSLVLIKVAGSNHSCSLSRFRRTLD